MTAFRTLDRVDVSGKRVLLRVDLNVPVENGVVTDATRIERAASSITELADAGAKVILLSHFGRPKGRDPKSSLKPVAAEVARVIKRPVKFVDDCIGEKASQLMLDHLLGLVELQSALPPPRSAVALEEAFRGITAARRRV
jgi:phosphoglycerate kinase